MELPLVDVCTDSVSASWPLVLQAVDQADFVALDLELSGLGSATNPGLGTFEERYKLLREVADSHSVVSVGVACFKWVWSGNKENALQCHVEVFNIWLLCQRAYIINPKAAKFLIDHGFDFNKQFSKGLPYKPVPCESLDISSPSIHSLLARLLFSHKTIVLHNGWIDLLFLFHTFYSPLPLSAATFMADLSEIFGDGEEEGGGGVFDTKAIAEYELRENASFLEYIFRKSQRDNSLRQANGLPYLSLHFTEYDLIPSSHGTFIEMVSVAPPPLCPGVLAIRVCTNFAMYGFCHSASCAWSHDVLVVIAQEEEEAEVQRLKRKRIKEAREERRKRRRAEDGGSCPAKDGEDVDNSGQPLDSDESQATSFVELFQKELDTAKTKLLRPSAPSEPRRLSFGHRAGFDAFMTGYTFSCYALRLAKPSDLELSSPSLRNTLLSGVGSLRGCLGNRGKSSPLRIAKSHFAKPSKTHRATWEGLTALFREQPSS